MQIICMLYSSKQIIYTLHFVQDLKGWHYSERIRTACIRKHFRTHQPNFDEEESEQVCSELVPDRCVHEVIKHLIIGHYFMKVVRYLYDRV
jgi:hypothetical protein